MISLINTIDKLCKFTFHFTNMDTVFLNEVSAIQFAYSLTKTPDSLKPYFSNEHSRLHLHEATSEYDVIFHSNSYGLNYISAKLNDENGQYLGSILVGPYLDQEPSNLMIERVIANNKMAISLKNILKQYYFSLPMISVYKSNATAEFLTYLISTLHTNGSDLLRIGYETYEFQAEYSVSSEIIKLSTEKAMEALEKRYHIENALLHAIEAGNYELFEQTISENSSLITEIPDRVPNDPLRSRKNNGIILNTLLRKAAEKGGVHPIYLDSISSKYAVQIEKCSSMQQLSALISSIQKGYCDAVRKLSLKNYSAMIRKAIEFIRMNLSQDLSLDSISTALIVSPYELSRQFKKETGESITEHINKRRINEALFILENEAVSITDASYLVGYNDVNYFTKVFKKTKGVTPSEYRKSRR